MIKVTFKETFDLVGLKNEEEFINICENINNKLLENDGELLSEIKGYLIGKNIDFTIAEKDKFEDYDAMTNLCKEEFHFSQIENKNFDEDNLFKNIKEFTLQTFKEFIEENNIKFLNINYRPQIYSVVPNITNKTYVIYIVFQYK